MDKPIVTYVSYIATTPEKLWEALTSGEFTRQYWAGRRIQSDWKPGSPVKHVKEDGSIDWQGQVLAADAPNRLAYTFEVMKGETPIERPSRVTIEISPFMGQVKLVVTHDDFEADSKVYPGVRDGWPALVSGLKSVLETGKPLFTSWG